MLKLFSHLICVFLLLSCNLSAVQYVPMDHTAVITVNMSFRNHNRIGIVGDRIKKAFFKGTNISVDVEEDSGQLFVQAARPNCPNTTLSIVSTTGNVQELELCFCDCGSEIVLLQPINRAIEADCMMNSEMTVCPLDSYLLSELVESIISGSVPAGFVSIEDPCAPQMISEGLKIHRVSRLVNEQQIIFIYRLHNVSSKIKSVTECQVNILDGDWVFLDRYQLRPNDCAMVLIGCIR